MIHGVMNKYLPVIVMLLSISTYAQTVPSITVKNINGARSSENQMIADGIILANKVITSDCFRLFILNAHFTETNDLTPVQIYELMKTTPVTVDIEMYKGNFKANYIDKTIGFENDPFDGVVHMNRHFVKTATMVADNLIHEAEGHSLGFHHYEEKSTSVPYGLNLAFEACNK